MFDFPLAKSYNDTCIESEQCKPLLGDKASCIDNQCSCNDTLHYKNGQCNDKKELNEQCATSGECFVAADPETVECRNGICQCKFNYSRDNAQNRCRPREKSKKKKHFLTSKTYQKFYRFFQHHEPVKSCYTNVNSISSCDNRFSFERRIFSIGSKSNNLKWSFTIVFQKIASTCKLTKDSFDFELCKKYVLKFNKSVDQVSTRIIIVLSSF